MTFRFATRNFLGNPVKFFSVAIQDLPAKPTPKPRVAHHILIVDASGSMYGDIGSIKEALRKMLVLDEYRDSQMQVSLFSYASSGDCIEHFVRVPVSDIVRSRNTKAQREIGSLRSRGMTCMTQAFEEALKLAQEDDKRGELTAVSLHTDGYFNDPSPTAEIRKVDALVTEFKKLKGTFVNTIGYRSYCDFNLLGKIANALSGKCWQAGDLKSFYDSIYSTSQLLSGQTAPSMCFEKNGDFDYQIFASLNDKKVVGGAGELNISGVKAGSSCQLLRFKEISEAEHKKSKDGDLSTGHILMFARTQLAEGRINAAKYALVASAMKALIGAHAKALTAKDLSALAEDLEKQIFSGDKALASSPRATKFGLEQVTSLPAVLEILGNYREDFVIDFDDLVASYKRRGVKRLTGSWSGDKLVKPEVRTELRDKEKYVSVGSFDFNRNNATINMMIPRSCKLISFATGKEIKEVAGIKLDLSDFKQYTIVGDGAVNVQSLSVKITSKRLHKALSDAGVDVGAYDPKSAVNIDLASRPLVDYAAKFGTAAELAKLPEQLARLHAADKLFSALIKEKSADLSDEQVEELKKVCISKNMYFSAPTTNPYTDLKTAISNGEIDVRLSYKVLVGTPEMLDASDLYSGNEFLRRWYEPSAKSITDPKKATMSSWFDSDFKVAHKKLSAKTKVGPVDKIMASVFDEFFRLTKTGHIVDLKNAEIDDKLSKKFEQVVNRKLTGDDAVQVLTDVKKAIGKELEAVYEKHVSPITFFVGASGLIPDEFGEISAMTPEQFQQKYPDAQLSKAMRESGMFFDIGHGAILTIFIEPVYFSTTRGEERVREIEQQFKTEAVS